MSHSNYYFAFFIESNILKFLTDYLSNVCTFLQKEFGINCQIISLNKQKLIINKQWTHGIFVQKVHYPIYKSLLENSINMYLLNTEQMTQPTYKANTIKNIIKYQLPLIDYSRENIHILQEIFPKYKFIYFPYPCLFKLPPIEKKTINLIMLQNSSHRLKSSQKIGKNIVDFNNKWGSCRDELIQSSKILLNIHFAPPSYNIFESIRCYGALELGTIVISEHGENDDLVLLKDSIIFCDEKNMQNIANYVLNNYEYIYKMLFNDTNLNRINQLQLNAYEESLEKF